jgi:hypothetical protein
MMKSKTIWVTLLVIFLSLGILTPVQAYRIPPGPQPLPYFPFMPGAASPQPQQYTPPGEAVLNPLTGLPVSDPAALTDPTAMLSITNWPVTVRPQSGLSYAAMIYELYIGDGQSRFFSLFYGDYPPAGSSLGPLRSGRLPYEPLREMYHGFLVMASAWKGVLEQLSDYSFYFSTDNTFSSAFVTVEQLKEIASKSDEQVDPAAFAVNRFEDQAPDGGMPAPDFWFIYNAINQAHWQYDAALGAYIRYQDQGDGQNFVLYTDQLNGETLTFENVILLFAEHRYCTPYAFEVDLSYMDKGTALLFRDGQVYKLYWTTKNTDYEHDTGQLRPIRFVDANGDPFPLKPGQTWIHLVPRFTHYWESQPSTSLYYLLNTQQPGSGNWVIRFYESLMEYDKKVCDLIRK